MSALSPTATAPVGDRDAAESAERLFEPAKRRIKFSELWTGFPVARLIAVRDMRVKYKQSILGPIWLFVQPLGLLAGLLVAFAGVTRADTQGVPSALFMLVGVSVWSFAQQTVAFGASAMIASGSLVRRSACPRVPLVLGTVVANTPAFLVMTATSLLLAVTLRGVPPQILLLPVATVWLLVLILGPVFALAGVAVRFRDAIAVVPLIMQAGAFFTPVGYSIQGAPETLRFALWANPFTGFLEAWRWIILATPPARGAIMVSVMETVILGGMGWWLFARLETRFSDYL